MRQVSLFYNVRNDSLRNFQEGMRCICVLTLSSYVAAAGSLIPATCPCSSIIGLRNVPLRVSSQNFIFSSVKTLALTAKMGGRSFVAIDRPLAKVEKRLQDWQLALWVICRISELCRTDARSLGISGSLERAFDEISAISKLLSYSPSAGRQGQRCETCYPFLASLYNKDK